MILPVRFNPRFILFISHQLADYEQQRKDLLRKHGIDLEDGSNFGEPRAYNPNTSRGATGTRRMDRKEVERIMGGGDGTGGVFTWREKNRKKVGLSFRFYSNISPCLVGPFHFMPIPTYTKPFSRLPLPLPFPRLSSLFLPGIRRLMLTYLSVSGNPSHPVGVLCVSPSPLIIISLPSPLPFLCRL